MSEFHLHIPLESLWKYSRDSYALKRNQLTHLALCEDCVAIVLLSKTSDSIEHLKDSLKNYGITVK
jgi:hypothetical protein